MKNKNIWGTPWEVVLMLFFIILFFAILFGGLYLIEIMQ